MLLKVIVGLSALFCTVAFLGGEPSSARGLYYIIWLSLSYYLFKKREYISVYLRRSPFSGFVTFVGLGIIMILVEETFAALAVNLLRVSSFFELLASIPQFYANNLLLLPGFIVAWYFLASRIAYTRKEIFILVGLFGLFSEKIYMHVLTIPILGIPLIPITMLAYMGIILPSLLSLRETGTREVPSYVRYFIGILFPIMMSVPFFLIHGYLVGLGYIDVTVLSK